MIPFLSCLGDFLPAKLKFYLLTYSYTVPWGRKLMPVFISGILHFLLKKAHFFLSNAWSPRYKRVILSYKS